MLKGVAAEKRNGTTVLSNVTYSNPDKAQFVDFAVAPDGGIRLLQLNRDGNWKLWDGDPANNKYYSPTYVPGNFAKAIAIRPDNLVCVMIESIQGNSGFGCKAWTLSAPTGVAGGGGFTLLGVTSTIAATVTPLDIAFDSSGNIHILWSTQSYGGAYYSSSIQFSTWKATDGSPTYTGLVTSVSGADRPVSFTVAPDGRIRVLWNNYASKYYFVDKYLFSGAPNYSYTYENEALAYY